MDDQGDVRLVDAQTEGIGGHHHVDLPVAEGILGVLPFGVLHRPAVGPDPVPEGAEQRRQPCRVPAGRHVDDGALPPERLHHAGDPEIAIPPVGATLHVVADLGPIDGGDQRLVRQAEIEQPDDVIQDPPPRPWQ